MLQIQKVGLGTSTSSFSSFFYFFPFYFYCRKKKKDEKAVSRFSMCVCSVLSDSSRRRGLELPGSSLHGNSWARTLQWVAISFPRESSWPQEWNSCVLCLLHWQADSLTVHHLYSWGVKKKKKGNNPSILFLTLKIANKLGFDIKAKATIANINKGEHTQLKGSAQQRQNEKAAYGMEENRCKSSIC